MKSNVAELIAKTSPESLRFQPELAKFVIDTNSRIVVETGSGVSSLFILEAMDKAGFGKLYSIDPSPFCGYEITHPRYELIKEKSFKALAPLYNKTGPWDFFLHDSDHWWECQTFEYEFGHLCLKKGGWIFADDRTWDIQTCWADFVKHRKLDEIIISDIAGAQKKTDAEMEKYDSEAVQENVWRRVKQEGAAWRKANGRPPCWTCDEEMTEWWKFPDKK